MNWVLLEYLFFRIIQIAFFVFAVLSIYDIFELREKHTNHEELRSVQNIAVGTTMILIGLFIFYKFRISNAKLSEIEISFIESCAPFLLVTGLSFILISEKILKLLQ